MTESRTVTLATVDHGDVTLPEPAWCIGHEDHVPQYRADLTHSGGRVYLERDGRHVGEAVVAQAPCAVRSTREIEGSVVLSYEPPGGMGPAAVRALADDLEVHAVRLRAFADELAALRGGGEAP
ncbi:hypothetical protein AB5J52_14050 [Streptomyces sp. R39]|uniref:SRPBCC family protein n=1 Tax=Streptomyces sp. R39 TaxID=3238631 RepID=A0AB39QIQ6_9ACTN